MTEEALLPELPCFCTSMRRATRAVTRLYDFELRETGLRVTQFTLLQALEKARAVSQGRLGTILSLDTTTLTRSLQPLIEEGWVRNERGDDRREKLLVLTSLGRRKLESATPAWRRAQARIKRSVGRDWQAMERDLRRIASAG